jgi:ligand-binding sensor domain-containing protein
MYWSIYKILRRKWLLVSTSWILLFTGDSFGLRKDTIHFDTIMGYEDLPNLSVNAIHQDTYGLIWVGTNDGLVRYNGDEYKIYRYSSQNPGSISSKKITAIGESPTGILWVSTYDGLNRYNRNQDDFTSYPLDSDDGELLTPGGDVIEFDSNGNVILGTIIGLPIFNPNTEKWDFQFRTYGEFDTFVNGIQKLGDNEFLLATTSARSFYLER